MKTVWLKQLIFFHQYSEELKSGDITWFMALICQRKNQFHELNCLCYPQTMKTMIQTI